MLGKYVLDINPTIRSKIPNFTNFLDGDLSELKIFEKYYYQLFNPEFLPRYR